MKIHTHEPNAELYRAIGRRVRALRDAGNYSQQAIADAAGMSVRFLSQVETGQTNISVGRLADLTRALGVSLAEVLTSAEMDGRKVVALLGLRGAGKSTLGRALAAKLGCSFVELDEEIERKAGLRLAEIFEIHGEAYYRRVEREALLSLLASGQRLVLATGGGIVSDPETYTLLRRATRTLWLRATPEEHWARVTAQGDARPMADRPRAMAELRALLEARAPLYAEAEHVLDTSGRALEALVDEAAQRLRAESSRPTAV
jgi:XRE family transcriptional regulator, aerobic/anaerobic benzoate catabolism transcriptional regulator